MLEPLCLASLCQPLCVTTLQGPAAALRSLSSQGGEQQGGQGTRSLGQGGTDSGQTVRHGDTAWTPSHPVALQHGGAEPPTELGAATEGPDPAPSSRCTMAPGRGDTCRAQGTAGTCAAAQAALCKATARHRQLVLQLGGSTDSPRLREERRRSSAEAWELSTGLQQALLGGLQQAAVSPEERRELERLWVLFLCALELFLQDLCCARRLCQLFSAQGGGMAPLHTGLGGRGLSGRRGSQRGGGPTQPPAAPGLEEEIEQVRATPAEMESRANIPLWTVEPTQVVGTGGTAAPRVAQGGAHLEHCCRVL